MAGMGQLDTRGLQIKDTTSNTTIWLGITLNKKTIIIIYRNMKKWILQ